LLLLRTPSHKAVRRAKGLLGCGCASHPIRQLGGRRYGPVATPSPALRPNGKGCGARAKAEPVARAINK